MDYTIVFMRFSCGFKGNYRKLFRNFKPRKRKRSDATLPFGFEYLFAWQEEVIPRFIAFWNKGGSKVIIHAKFFARAELPGEGLHFFSITEIEMDDIGLRV